MVKINHKGITQSYSADEAVDLLLMCYKDNYTPESAVAVINAMIIMQRMI